jgi:Fur family ferric uptake transcriptional regulator
MSEDQKYFKELLKEKGYKLTPQRMAVLDALIINEGKHLNTEEIYQIVKKTHPEMGMATVYRTLLLFDRIELVYKVDLDDNLYRYEINKHNEDHRHHHLICTKCNSVEQVENDALDALEEQILKLNGFLVRDHRVKFYGYCKDCLIRITQF